MGIIVSAHSGLRYVVLILLLLAIIKAFSKKNKNSFEKGDKMVYLFAMIFTHIQITLGLVLYFVGSGKVSFTPGWMKNPQLRFFGMEHILMMLIAAILITIGRRKSENAIDANKKHKAISVLYTIALIIIFLAIPWPFLRANLGGGWI